MLVWSLATGLVVASAVRELGEADALVVDSIALQSDADPDDVLFVLFREEAADAGVRQLPIF